MRAILLVLIIGIVALIAAFATGYISISQTQGTRAPTVSAEDGQIRATGGQPPAFEVQTGSLTVGTTEANVAVPKVEVRRERATVEVPAVKVERPGQPVSNQSE